MYPRPSSHDPLRPHPNSAPKYMWPRRADQAFNFDIFKEEKYVVISVTHALRLHIVRV
jgi:hypothetical protein